MPKPPEQKPADAGTAGEESERRLRAALERHLGADAAERPPPAVPDHVLLRRIGRGAYGEVWLARNALGTLRAVKVVYRANFEDEHPYEREFCGIVRYEPISRTHEGLVQVLHVGRNDATGCFYYVMELADGVGRANSESVISESVPPRAVSTDLLITDSLITAYSPRTLRSELRRQQRLAPVEAAQLALHLAGALAQLHARGLVHRDIKPGNVIFVNGRPKLADIGLVAGAGVSRSFVGTEGFIPPEGPGSAQADIYSLGKLLYELATGRDRLDFPQLPPLATQGGDGEALLELNEVMTRACAPEPQQRYASATELQAELNLFLAGRSLRRTRKIERYLARSKKLAFIACGLLVLAAAALWFSKREERHARERAQAANEHASAETQLRQRAEAAERETQQQLYTALLEQARATVRSGEMGHRVRALDALRRAAAISNSVELRREVFAALALPDLRFERTLAHGPEITLALLDPAFERIALGRSAGPVEIRAVADDRLLATLPAGTNLPAHFAYWSRDGRFLAVKRDRDGAGNRADWEVWEPSSRRRVLVITNAVESAVSFHPREPRIAAGLPGRTVAIWNLTDGRETARFQMTGTVFRVEFSPDGERLAVAQQARGGSLVSVHDVAGGAMLASHLFKDFVSFLNWQPDGRRIAVSDHGGAVHLVEAESGEALVLGRHKAEAARVFFSPDGAHLVSSGWDYEFICWDTRAMRRAFTMSFKNFNAFDLQFRADGRACAVETPAGVQLHAFEQPSGHREFAEDLGGLLAHAAFSPDGRWLAASGGKHFGVWSLLDGGPGALTNGTSDTRLSFTADGELFADRRGDCSRWRIAPGTKAGLPPTLQKLPLPVPTGFVSLSLVSNGVVFTAARGSKLVPFDALDQAPTDWKPTADGLNAVSPDGRWLAMHRSYTPHLYVYRLPEMERVTKLTNAANISRFTFSPASDEVAVGSGNGVEFWSTVNWQRTRVLTNFNRALYAPDGRTVWLSTKFRTGELCRTDTAEPLLPLPPGMMPLAVSPDGRHFAVSVDAERLQVWDLAAVRKQLSELGMDWAGAE